MITFEEWFALPARIRSQFFRDHGRSPSQQTSWKNRGRISNGSQQLIDNWLAKKEGEPQPKVEPLKIVIEIHHYYHKEK
jgi:hypothetical protein|tara:strand:+ start:207 stop:443 length:237 start_codon:yes stop_codon:yes gene_type:complete